MTAQDDWLLPDTWSQWVLQQPSTQAWLQAQDDDPTALIAAANPVRLGLYAASLLEYWFRCCPAIGSCRVCTRVPVRSPAGGRAELKLLAWHSDCGPRASSADCVTHLESSIKFSMQVAATSLSPQLPPQAVLSNFVSPDLEENLWHRFQAAQAKLRPAAAPAVHQWLTEAVGATPVGASPSAVGAPPRAVRSVYRALGAVYYPLQHRGFLGDRPSHIPVEAWDVQAGWCGWWARTLEELLEAKQGAAGWLCVRGLFWLGAPLVEAGEAQGCAALGIPPVHVLSTSELAAAGAQVHV